MSRKSPKKPKFLKKSIIKKVNILFIFFIGGGFIFVFSIINLLNYLARDEESVLGVRIEIETKTSLEQGKIFWENFLVENPSYLQGWLELAKIEVQLENFDAARSAFSKAKTINPNSELIKNAESVLGILGS